MTEQVAPLKNVVGAMVDLVGERGAVFVGHSLGTSLIAWMLHDPRGSSLVKGAVFLDPINFMLFDPSIAFNFIHRKPTSTIELLMHYFVARELFIAHTLSRHFSWSHNALFPEELPESSVVVISSDDLIVPAKRTYDYLKASVSQSVELIWFEGTQHGEMCLHSSQMDLVAQKIQERCIQAS